MPRRGKNKSQKKRVAGFIRQTKWAKLQKERKKCSLVKEKELNFPKNEVKNHKVSEPQFPDHEDAPPEMDPLPPYRPVFPKDHPQAPPSRNGCLGGIHSNDYLYDTNLATVKDCLQLNWDRCGKNSLNQYLMTAPQVKIPREKYSKKIRKVNGNKK